MTEKALRPYIGEVDVIVLVSYAVTIAALYYLRWKYPYQAFVGFEPDMAKEITKFRESDCRVMLLATGIVRESPAFSAEKKRLTELGVKLIEPECGHWASLIDDGEMTEARFRMEVGWAAEERIDAILPYSTNFTDMNSIFESVYGMQVIVTSDYQKVIRSVCRAAKLIGTDIAV